MGTTKVGKAPVPAKKGTTKVGNKSVSDPLLVREYPAKIYFLAGNLFLQLVYLADNLQQILLAKQVETAKQRRRVQKQEVKK